MADEDSKNAAYVRLNKAHMCLSGLGVGIWGVLTIIAALYPKTESGVVPLMLFMLIAFFILLLNYYLTLWTADDEGVRFKNIAKRIFIPAYDVRQIGINIHAGGEFLFIQGTRKRIGIPLQEDGIAEFMEYVMKNYSENIWFVDKDLMREFIKMRKK